MGKVSRKQAAENRSKVVAAASSLFRQKGLDGVGIDDVMAEAGLTRGGFYGQFGSKEVLAAEACSYAFDGVEQAWSALDAKPASRLRRLVEFYFTPKSPGRDCPMATLSGDSARAPRRWPVRRAFTAGLRRLANLVAGEEPDDKGLVVLAAMVGAVVLRRASDDGILAASIESAVLRFAGDGPE